MDRTGGESQASYVMEVKHVLPNVPRCNMSFGESEGLARISGQVHRINNVFWIFLPPLPARVYLGFEDIEVLALGNGIS